MATLKCKMCGGNIEVGENQNIGVCDSCGSTMTIPNVNDERILNLFDRANHFRLQNEFDKALATYESILSENNKNAEAHWGCVLSRYGIEYVEDPKTHKRVPTCHRVQNEPVLSDLDYKAAVEYTDDVSAKNLYQQEAEAIAEIQKNILSIANNEAPYDVFICYKETDNNGRRTVDSTLAQDIYYQLTNEGYKVFFSRITLEDKLGAEYEPYIFSALNSAKVMLVIGTSKDYFNAVWVKNEWARFLDLARKDKSKMIIPCYRDMDAYELPDELSMFQSQDMSKIGFIQDLIRGIKKVLQKETPQPSVTVVNNTAEAFNSEVILKRAFMLLEDAQWQKADELLEQVLNHEPENAKAYIGKLMIDFKVNKEENLGKIEVDFSENANYQKVIRFADDVTKDRIQNYCNIAKKQLFKRILILLEHREWEEANVLLEQVLNHEPENAKAYICKLMIDFKVNKEENLVKASGNFSGNANYQNAFKFADAEYKNTILEYKNAAKKNFEVSKNRIAMADIEFDRMCIGEYKKKFFICLVAFAVFIIMLCGIQNPTGITISITLISFSMAGWLRYLIGWCGSKASYKAKLQHMQKIQDEMQKNGDNPD